jgi:hypothetical protein
MNQEKIDKLNEIGFDISGEHADVREDQIRNAKSKSDVIWEENFNALVSYKEKFGTCDVKEKKKGDNDEWKKLASWVSLQRTKYKKKKSGKSVGRTFPITDEQIKKLYVYGSSLPSLNMVSLLTFVLCFEFFLLVLVLVSFLPKGLTLKLVSSSFWSLYESMDILEVSALIHVPSSVYIGALNFILYP